MQTYMSRIIVASRDLSPTQARRALSWKTEAFEVQPAGNKIARKCIYSVQVVGSFCTVPIQSRRNRYALPDACVPRVYLGTAFFGPLLESNQTGSRSCSCRFLRGSQ